MRFSFLNRKREKRREEIENECACVRDRKEPGGGYVKVQAAVQNQFRENMGY